MHTTTIGRDGHRYRTPFNSTPTRAIEVSYYTMTRQERAGILCVGLLALGVVALAPATRAADTALHLVLTPSQKPTDLLAAGTEFGRALGTLVGASVRVTVASDYAAVIEALRNRTADLAFVHPVGYVLANREAKATIVFREVVFSGAHDASMRALLNGHVDAIASFDLAREQYLTDPAERERITWVAETPPIPEAGIAARVGLDPAMVARVRAALLQIRGPAYAALLKRLYEIDGFAPADDHDYDPVRAATDLLGVRPR